MATTLLVEHDPNVARAALDAIAHHGRARHVTTVRDALGEVRARRSVWAAAIVDDRLPDGSGLDLAARLAGDPYRLPVLLMVNPGENRLANDATVVGVQVAFKPLGKREIEAFLIRVRAELPVARVDAAFEALSVSAGWSAREREIVHHALDGSGRKEITARMGAKTSTTKSQVRSLLTKCGEPDLGAVVRRIHGSAMERPSSAPAHEGPPPLVAMPRPGLWRRHRLTRVVGGGWVLVVDDVPEYARSYARLLQRWVTCEVACSVEEALALATRPGLVGALVDVRMGRVDGIDDIATPLRKTYPGVDIRIISGANDWAPDVARATRAGFSYILKDGNLEPLKDLGLLWSRAAERIHVEGESELIAERLAPVIASGALTPLQLQALGFAVRGLNREEIAARLCEHSAGEVAAQLVHHEGGHRLARLGAASEERLEVLAQDPMQRRRLRVVRRAVLSEQARCGARGHAAPESKRRYGPASRELQGKRASAGGVAAAWRRAPPARGAPDATRRRGRLLRRLPRMSRHGSRSR